MAQRPARRDLYWGVAISFARPGWRYNSLLVIQGVIVSLGVSVMVRAFIPRPASSQIPLQLKR